MFRKIGFILGVIILGGAYPFLINHIKAFGQMDYTQWFCTYAGVGIVMLLAALMASVRFGLPKFSGSLLVRLIAFIIMLLFIPIAVTIQFIKFIFQGGIGYIFSSSSAKPKKENVPRETPVQKDGRRKLSKRDFEYEVEHLCASCRIQDIFPGAYGFSRSFHKLEDITVKPDVDFPRGNRNGKITLNITIKVTVFGEDGVRECEQYKQPPVLMRNKLDELIVSLRQKYQGLDCGWDYNYHIEFK